MTFAWHFNCLLLPENSFVQRWRKTALVLTWDAKMMNGPIKKDEMQGDTFQWVGINQGWPGTGPHLPGAWLWQSWNSLCSLVIKVYGVGSSTTAGAGLKPVPHAIVFTLPVRGDRDSKNESFSDNLHMRQTVEFRLIPCSACLPNEKTIISKITSN